MLESALICVRSSSILTFTSSRMLGKSELRVESVQFLNRAESKDHNIIMLWKVKGDHLIMRKKGWEKMKMIRGKKYKVQIPYVPSCSFQLTMCTIIHPWALSPWDERSAMFRFSVLSENNPCCPCSLVAHKVEKSMETVVWQIAYEKGECATEGPLNYLGSQESGVGNTAINYQLWTVDCELSVMPLCLPKCTLVVYLVVP